MIQKYLWKQRATYLAVADQTEIDAWKEYKQYRNKINNRKKHDEKLYKTENIAEVVDTNFYLAVS